MPRIPYQLASAGFLIVYLGSSWLLIDKLGFSATQATVIKLLASGFGLAAYGGFLWLRGKRAVGAQAPGAPGAPGAPAAGVAGGEELEAVLRDAEARLQASRLGKEAKIGTLPALVLIGETRSAKTSAVIASGTEPELLSGHIYQDGLVVPTRMANVWFARNAVVIEAGGGLMDDPGRWMKLVQAVRPARLRSLFKSQAQAPRGAVVCIDAEKFLQPGAQEAMTQTARKLHMRLRELAETLGIYLPVYVVFTRCDRVPFFQEYLANFTDEETRQVVGATLPVALGNRAGVYAEEETRRLTACFQDVVQGLCEFRPTYLAREHDPQKLPGVYEFPREFRKLRAVLVQFLVDLCRPSQLQSGPFLRGFYFSGVRPVEVREIMKAPQGTDPAMVRRKGDASGLFSLQPDRSDREPTSGAQSVQTRRVPQWVWLWTLFNEVILRDQEASSASAQSAGGDKARRLLLAAGAALALLLTMAWTISYFNNRSLQGDVSEAVRGIGGVQPAGTDLASVDSLKRLETLRQSLETLTRYDREGAPWSLRWGLYTGDGLLPVVRKLYFSRFNQLMFGQTQAGLLDWLKNLPPTPEPSAEYQPTYDTLKGYLITTSHPQKSTKMFLSPLLLSRWAGKTQLDPERRRLAQAQFDFYAEELKIANPFSSENDGMAIEKARRYLNGFSGIDRIYALLLSTANSKNKSINFNRDVAGSGKVIANDREIAGAFTKGGSVFMLDAIKNVQKYFEGEEWVLGPQATKSFDASDLGPKLLARYRQDLFGNWREYLDASKVLAYANVKDAADKLKQLSSFQSHLMSLFCIASENTSAAPDEQKVSFQPVQHVTPSPCTGQLSGRNNEQYLTALAGLATGMESLGGGTPAPGDPNISSTLQQAATAKNAVRSVALQFRGDPEGKVAQQTQKLMEDPITAAERLLQGLGPAQLNAAGRSFCADFAKLVRKYPFNPNSKEDATIEDVNNILRPPSGSLWTFYDNNLKNYLMKQGQQYSPTPGSSVRLMPGFVNYFNRLAQLSEAMYRFGATEPALTYTMRAVKSEGVKALRLRIDGQELKSTGDGGQQMTFKWPGGSVKEARLLEDTGAREDELLRFDGVWAAFRLFGDAEKFDATGNGWNLEWYSRTGQAGQYRKLPTGNPLTFRYFLDLGGAPPVFKKGYLGSYSPCVSQVAQ